MNDHTTDTAIRANPALRGRSAYLASLAAVPAYQDGTPRKDWEALGDVERWSWERPIRHESVIPANYPEFGWDVLEDAAGFHVYSRGAGMVITSRATLKEAADYAYNLASKWL